MSSDFLLRLNEKQLEAVKSKYKENLVLAGAGTGKTSVLTSRIGYVIGLGANSSSIFAATFTNKAAKEMKERVEMLLDDPTLASDLWIGTFHGLCNKIIKSNTMKLGLPKNYQIIDTTDQKSLIKRVAEEIEVDNSKKIDKKKILPEALNFINKAKENGRRPDKANDLLEYMGLEPIILDIYIRYEKVRFLSGLLDYGDILLYVIELFEKEPEVLNYYREKFNHVMVDEYQDTNRIQNKFINMISKGNYLFFVGDDDQSIYGWRGAKIKYILELNKKYENLKTIKLEQNYRSTKKILACSNSIIAKNTMRLGKDLWSQNDSGENITVIESDSTELEAYTISKFIKRELNLGTNPNDITILYRSNAISRAFEAKFAEHKIPYKIVSGLSFWERGEVKDMLSYLDIINNENNDVSFERVVNKPSRKFGQKALEKLRDYSNKKETPMFLSLDNMINEGLIKGQTASNLSHFINVINTIKSEKHLSIKEMIIKIIENLSFYKIYEKEPDEVRDDKLNNINELIYFADKFVNTEDDMTDIESFLHHAKLQSDNTKNGNVDTVKLMTIHAAKGLEFPIVFVAGLEEFTFPSKRSIYSDDLEEERRLAYVSITRAEKKLYLSFSTYRYGEMLKPSRFLNEIPIEYLSYHSDSRFSNSIIGNKIKSLNIAKTSSSNDKFKVGEEYNHVDFGLGEIRKVNNNSIDVYFGMIGIKNIIL